MDTEIIIIVNYCVLVLIGNYSSMCNCELDPFV